MDKKVLYYQLSNLGIKLKKVNSLDEKLDWVIRKYYGRNVFFNPYLNSKNKLIRMLIEGEFPTVEQWNEIADLEGYLSHISLEYIGECNWKQLKKNLLNEIKEMLF